ncbi:hypothetical protein TanjilG_19950 [Lupinus angustifolius]|uniref:Retroviral polymerase SH3-like domain-containing protein n=1 Tax=Lupinus angustifolius TaxID=3871 RepID=A0A4P1RCM8_LUPAN|nr:hypothetical protein TanjilG_19950 [Lupinus angustifolius]
MNMVRCMLKCKGLPHHLWGEAVTTSTYVLNRCPTQRLNNMVPEEVWTGKKPLVNHFKVFGSLCYRHIPDQIRRKLDDKGELMVFVSYNSTGSYKLLNHVTKQTVFNMDVKFDEMSTWNDLLKKLDHKESMAPIPI